MKYLSVEQMAQRWGLAPRTVRNYCAGGKIPGAALLGKTWSIPETAKRPDRAKRENEPVTLLSILLARFGADGGPARGPWEAGFGKCNGCWATAVTLPTGHKTLPALRAAGGRTARWGQWELPKTG